jgi:hypothetical protein
MNRWFFCVLLLSSCQSTTNEGPFLPGRVVGVNRNSKLEETSGLAASRRYPGFLWAHNDSGNPPDLFLLDSTGQTSARLRLAGANNKDWEDMAAMTTADSVTWLFIGDIGDNLEKRTVKRIYKLAEPPLDEENDIPVADTLFIRLSDEPRDTEAMLADPLTRNLYLVTKREGEVLLYEIKFPFTADTLVAERTLQIPLRQVTAGDISTDGLEILLKTYDGIYYWKRLPGQSVPDALRQPGTELSYEREPQGESIAWALDGSGFYTLSENAKGERGRLYFYARRSAGQLLDALGPRP